MDETKAPPIDRGAFLLNQDFQDYGDLR